MNNMGARKEIFPWPQLCGKMLGLISIAKAQVHLDCLATINISKHIQRYAPDRQMFGRQIYPNI